MARWRTLASLVVALLFSGTVHAQNYSLTEAPPAGSYFRIELSMSLAGELKLTQDGKDIALKESATATQDYVERILDSGADGLAARSARVYKEATVTIHVGDDKLQRGLRPDRTFLVAQRERDGILTFSPNGTLTREELDVTEHFDTLAVTGLLPGKEVAIGDSWKLSNGVVQALCHLQGLADQALTCKLTELRGDVAVFSIAGSVSGIDLGASVKSNALGTGRFDLKERRLVAVEWKQADELGQGPVSPASTVEVTHKLARTPIAPVNELQDVVLAKVPARAPPRAMTDLELKDPRGRNELIHPRDWLLVARTPEHTVLRLMDRGEFVAQLSIAPWKRAEPGKHLSPDQVKEIVANSPGWEMEKLLKAEEVPLGNGQWAYLVAGEGDLDEVRAVQYFYLVAGPDGDQAMLTFTMTPAQTQKLGGRDLELVRGFLLPGARREAPDRKAPPGR